MGRDDTLESLELKLEAVEARVEELEKKWGVVGVWATTGTIANCEGQGKRSILNADFIAAAGSHYARLLDLAERLLFDTQAQFEQIQELQQREAHPTEPSP